MTFKKNVFFWEKKMCVKNWIYLWKNVFLCEKNVFLCEKNVYLWKKCFFVKKFFFVIFFCEKVFFCETMFFVKCIFFGKKMSFFVKNISPWKFVKNITLAKYHLLYYYQTSVVTSHRNSICCLKRGDPVRNIES